jgi:beta-fructofuranosidase
MAAHIPMPVRPHNKSAKSYKIRGSKETTDMTDEITKTEEMIQGAQALKEKFERDPYRPRYHFTPPWAWMNDINGAIYWKGQYHIFYQHNPEGGYWKWMQWGHASSVDLVHWVHHPIALTPTLDGPDRDGCFSGGALVSKAGVSDRQSTITRR